MARPCGRASPLFRTARMRGRAGDFMASRVVASAGRQLGKPIDGTHPETNGARFPTNGTGRRPATALGRKRSHAVAGARMQMSAHGRGRGRGRGSPPSLPFRTISCSRSRNARIRLIGTFQFVHFGSEKRGDADGATIGFPGDPHSPCGIWEETVRGRIILHSGRNERRRDGRLERAIPLIRARAAAQRPRRTPASRRPRCVATRVSSGTRGQRRHPRRQL